MAKTKLTLTSHYNKTELHILMDADKAEQLMSKETPMEYITEDLDNVRYGNPLRYLSEGQAKKINGYLSGIDYFDKITK